MKEVKIYTTPTCHFCKEAKAYFKENNVAYEEYDVQSDLEKRQEMFDKSGQMGVPVIMIGEDITVGFDREKIESLLGI